MMNLSSMRKGAKLGQHFLMHPRIAERMARAAGIAPGDTVLEVGPGTGILTAALLTEGAHVVAVETDAALLPGLEERFLPEIANGQLELVHADIRAYLADEPASPGGAYCVVANIPYYLTGELIRILLMREHQPRSMTLLVQKEVAERIARSRAESLLSLSVKAYGMPRYEFTVPRGAFRPAPSVDSAVLTVRDISRKRFTSPREEARFFDLLHAGFAHKRKLLKSNMANILPAIALIDSGLNPLVRAEELSLDSWFALLVQARS